MARRRSPLSRLVAWLRAPWRFELTREGKYFVVMTVGIAVAASNTGNNLLFLLLGMMISLLGAALVLSEISLWGLSIQRCPPARAHAGRAFLMGIRLRNTKARFPSFSVEVEDELDGALIEKKCYFLKLPAGRLQQTSYRHLLPRRGAANFTSFRVSTKFPFALFRRSRRVTLPSEVVVLPAVHPVRHPPPLRRGWDGDEAIDRRGRHGVFHGLREYQGGDDPRLVHWRTTARRGRPMLRENDEAAARQVTIFVDNALPNGLLSDAHEVDALERAISGAASLAVHYVELGCAVRLVARGAASPWAMSPAQSLALLRFLALLPTVDDEQGFSARPDGASEEILVIRQGSRPPAGFPAAVVEA